MENSTLTSSGLYFSSSSDRSWYQPCSQEFCAGWQKAHENEGWKRNEFLWLNNYYETLGQITSKICMKCGRWRKQISRVNALLLLFFTVCIVLYRIVGVSPWENPTCVVKWMRRWTTDTAQQITSSHWSWCDRKDVFFLSESSIYQWKFVFLVVFIPEFLLIIVVYSFIFAKIGVFCFTQLHPREIFMRQQEPTRLKIWWR